MKKVIEKKPVVKRGPRLPKTAPVEVEPPMIKHCDTCTCGR